MEIKEFPKAPKKLEGWIVRYDCKGCWQPRDSAKTRHKGTIHETAAALAVAIVRKTVTTAAARTACAKHPDRQHATVTIAAAPACADHLDCQHATVATAAAPAIKRTLEESDEDLSRANKRVRAAESRSAELQRQLDAAVVDKATFENHQSVDAKTAKRRAVNIDSDNQEQ